MKNQIAELLKASALTLCLFGVLPNVFAGDIEDEEVRAQLFNTLDNLEAAAAGLGLNVILEEKISIARGSVLSADTQELDAISSKSYNNLQALETTTGKMRLLYAPEQWTEDSEYSAILSTEPGSKIQSSSPQLNAEALTVTYPNVHWGFSFENKGLPPTKGGKGGSDEGICKHPGTSVELRFATMNIAHTLEAVKEISAKACEETIVGENFSLFCIITEIAFFVASGANENQALCNEAIDGAEISATWEGVQTIHENIVHLHEDLEKLELDESGLAGDVSALKQQLGTHDSDLKSKVARHVTEVTAQVTSHDSDIKAKVDALDTGITAQITTHDTEIKAQVDALDTEITEQVDTHDTQMKSQVGTHDTMVKSQVAAHDSEMKSQVATHAAEVNSQISTHDAAIKLLLEIDDADVTSQIVAHDAAMKSQVGMHDADLKAQLGAHDAGIISLLGEIRDTALENQRLKKISMARQLEIMRLLITPTRDREINNVVLACTGDNCPEFYFQILSCKNGNKWPCDSLVGSDLIDPDSTPCTGEDCRDPEALDDY